MIDGFALAIESSTWLLKEGFTYFQVRYPPENKIITYRISDFISRHRINYPPYDEQYVLPTRVATNISNIH